MLDPTKDAMRDVSTCRRKCAYRNRQQAKRALRRLLKVKETSRIHVGAGGHLIRQDVYPCPVCGQWHIGRKLL